MALVAVFARDRGCQKALARVLCHRHCVVTSPSWSGLERLVRERPVTVAVVDVASFPPPREAEEALFSLRSAFPHLGVVLAVRRPSDPMALFRLGRAAIPDLVLLSVDQVEVELPRALARAAMRGASARVLRALSPHLARRELDAVRLAMDGVHRRWSAEEFADEIGLSRPFLSERLKGSRLPSAGHLLIWTRLLHAGFWLAEPGRTGESVSRQLEYSSGAAFRRALKRYTGATPTEVVARGGMAFVLERFLEACGFREPDAGAGVSVA